MTLKLEAKKAEAKRRGNKHDLVIGPPNPSPRKVWPPSLAKAEEEISRLLAC